MPPRSIKGRAASEPHVWNTSRTRSSPLVLPPAPTGGSDCTNASKRRWQVQAQVRERMQVRVRVQVRVQVQVQEQVHVQVQAQVRVQVRVRVHRRNGPHCMHICMYWSYNWWDTNTTAEPPTPTYRAIPKYVISWKAVKDRGNNKHDA